MPQSSDPTAARERQWLLLHEGLAALATIDEATREAYLSEWQGWENTPLTPALSAGALLARWHPLPALDPARFRADLDGFLRDDL